jgi:hypothetical protein
VARAQALARATARIADEALAGDDPRLAALLRVLSRDGTAKYAGTLAAALPPRAVATSLGKGDGALAAWAAVELVSFGRADALRAFARDAVRDVNDVESGALDGLVSFARAAAVPSPNAARKLIDLAWRSATPEGRRFIPTEELDVAMTAGLEAAAWPEWARALLAHVVVTGAYDRDRKDALSKRMHGLVATTGDESAVRKLLKTWAPALVPSIWVEPTPPEKLEAKERERKAGGKGGVGWGLVGAVVAVVWLTHRCSRTEVPESPRFELPNRQRPTRPPERTPPSHAPLTAEEQRELAALEERARGPEPLTPGERARLMLLRQRARGSAPR